MAKRIKLTEKEKLAFNETGNTGVLIDEKNVDKMFEKEKTMKFNAELEKFQEGMEQRNKEVEEAQKDLGYGMDKADIKPLYSRLLVKPFAQNPFQKMKMKGNIVVDAGGYKPHYQINPMTGKYEEQEQFIITGYVVETGPEVKYLKVGDVVYYRKDTAVPVPFLDWGMVSIAENQVIAAVNDDLTKRFGNGRGTEG